MHANHILLIFIAVILSFGPQTVSAADRKSEDHLSLPKNYAKAKGVHAAVNPPVDHSLESIISFQEWNSLNPADQEIYLLGVQKLMQDLERDDVAAKIEYQSASREPVWLKWLMPTAVAGDAGRRCVYAGFVSEMDVNGRYCLAPRSEGCSKGQIQCNPLLYGEGKCTASGKSATSYCTRSAKSPAAIAKEIRAKGASAQAKWGHLRNEISGYCSNPRPTQTRVCAIVKTRMIELSRIVGKGTLAPKVRTPAPTAARTPAPTAAPDAGAAPTDAPATGAPAGAVVPRRVVVRPVGPTDSLPPAADVLPSSTDSSAELSAAVTPPVTPPIAPPASTAAPKVGADGLPSAPAGVCNPLSLVGSINYSGEDARGWNFMDMESAQTIMCSREEVPERWHQLVRTRAADRLKDAPLSDKYAKEARRNIDQLLKNFDICWREAVRLRKEKVPPTFGQDSQLVYLSNGFVDITIQGRKVTTMGGVSDLEGLYQGNGISLCNIQITDDYGIGRTASRNGFPSRPPAPAAR